MKLARIWYPLANHSFEVLSCAACAFYGAMSLIFGTHPVHGPSEVVHVFEGLANTVWSVSMILGGVSGIVGVYARVPRIEGAAMILLFVTIAYKTVTEFEPTPPGVMTATVRALIGAGFLLRGIYLWQLHRKIAT